MRALIFADRDSHGLAPLDRDYALATLPLAGKELILYTLEDLVRSRVTEILFVVADHAGRIERLLGDGRRWGASFRFVLGRGGERPSLMWSRLRIADDQPLLVLRGDLLRSPAVAEFMLAAQGTGGTALCGLGSDPRGGLILLRPGHADPRALLDMLYLQEPASPPAEGCLPLPDVEVRLLETLQGYHQACLDLVSGRINGLGPDGRELALGLSVGLHARVTPRSLKQGRAYVGNHSRVHPEAELLGDVMIGRDVVIDRAAMLCDSVILPHSYVGEMLEVNNAIVAGDTLMRVDTGVVLTISDAFLLGRLGSRASASAQSSGSGLIDRLGGLLLFLLSLPLWPIALVAAALQSGSGAAAGAGATAAAAASVTPSRRLPRLVTYKLLIGNRSTAVAAGGVDGAFLSWRFNTRIPVLSLLPRLLAVIRGDLRLTGVSPLSPEESRSRSEDWQRVRDQAPVGLIGPTQLLLAEDAPLDERLMSDAFYVGQGDWWREARLYADALRTLFSRHAWSRPSRTSMLTPQAED
ncbi:MAG: hypothetical protein C1943_01485 [Halochromatium sp.]|nr:hypothetical protein [Halochromatium sp.]